MRLIEHGLSTTVAAERLNISERGVRKLIESGTLPAQKLGDKWFIDPADLERSEVKDRKAGRPSRKGTLPPFTS